MTGIFFRKVGGQSGLELRIGTSLPHKYLTWVSMARFSRSTTSLSSGFFFRYSGLKNACKQRGPNVKDRTGSHKERITQLTTSHNNAKR